jgi:hypothetical protein
MGYKEKFSKISDLFFRKTKVTEPFTRDTEIIATEIMAVGGMVKFYGVTKEDFENKLASGSTQIEYGRSPISLDQQNYIVSFVAFNRADDDNVDTLEVRKFWDGHHSSSLGLSKEKYSPEEFAELKDEFHLDLKTSELQQFIEEFPWNI